MKALGNTRTMNYQNRIKELREDGDLSQKIVAEKIHVAQTTYSDYETGKVRIPLENLISLARYYNVDMNYISGITNQRHTFPKN